MIQVLEILPDNKAVVSTAGLYRVVDQESGEILGELLDELEADTLAGLMGRFERQPAAKISYDALAQSANSGT